MSETANAYSITISANTGICYLKFKNELEKLDQNDLENLINIFSELGEPIVNFIFDLSELNYINRKCYRPLAMAQQHARSKTDSIVAVIVPSAAVKKLLLEEGLIRPKEVCTGINKVGLFIKNLRPKA